mmetsp:Transcript_27436/g.44532  ORF Transcript_27436/g.44532 Transcript_27436/m.44532 type:complete len:603 (+) Transcript_27436:130-1938(+)
MIRRFATLAWTCLASTVVSNSNATELRYPEVWDADANPSITLDFDWLTIDPGFGGRPFRTRALGGSVPGPTIKLSPGTVLNVRFRNLLADQPESYKTSDFGRYNMYGDADMANLHFHGGHVSSVLPADDTTLVVHPGRSYDFTVPFPEDHMPGLHWVHPHHHGSSSLHLVGGAALALIVKDAPNSLPKEVENAEEKVLVFQDWDVPTARNIARKAGDEAFASSLDTIEGGLEVGQRFVTVNGMYQPTMTVVRGVWQRWRILYAGWQDLPLKLFMETNEAGCELQLLAKDGIFITDYPREITKTIPLPPGGRADFMVRCSNVGSTQFSALTRDTLTVVSQESDITRVDARDGLASSAVPEDSKNDTTLLNAQVTADLTPWQPASYPDYLQSVMEMPPSDGCTCPFVLKGYGDTSRMNGKTYRSGNNFQHTTYLGAIVQRELVGIYEHSYHQHIYPFQLVSGFEETEYFHFGDWHDTLLDGEGKKPSGVTTWVIRYQTTDIGGKMMVHCHNTMHADHGMMAKEYVREVAAGAGGSCECGIFGPISGPGLIEDDVGKVTVMGSVEEEVEEEANEEGLDENGGSTISYCVAVVTSCAAMIVSLSLD